ncbi:MAG: cell division protein ZapA [Gammaproteobacteria bacterium]|jgi:cell division protein ZapA|nr:cell division protein ZapA [Gammaproteobacteria bacterium]
MNKESDAVKIHILDKEYLVACPDEEKDSLVASANHLSEKMMEIRESGKVVGIDRIAVMAGLNLAHDVIESGGGNGKNTSTTTSRLKKLNTKIDKTLAKYRQTELN